jgi:hypothetical protein
MDDDLSNGPKPQSVKAIPMIIVWEVFSGTIERGTEDLANKIGTRGHVTSTESGEGRCQCHKATKVANESFSHSPSHKQVSIAGLHL